MIRGYCFVLFGENKAVKEPKWIKSGGNLFSLKIQVLPCCEPELRLAARIIVCTAVLINFILKRPQRFCRWHRSIASLISNLWNTYATYVGLRLLVE